jgi:limonene-1,2-epoxide hydrolase
MKKDEIGERVTPTGEINGEQIVIWRTYKDRRRRRKEGVKMDL